MSREVKIIAGSWSERTGRSTVEALTSSGQASYAEAVRKQIDARPRRRTGRGFHSVVDAATQPPVDAAKSALFAVIKLLSH